ncbi:MAG: cytochrome P450 [Ilumatobacteraceae bacterium]
MAAESAPDRGCHKGEMKLLDSVDVDLWSSSSFAAGHPHDQYRWMREHDPVHWNDEPAGRGFWAVTRYDDVKLVGKDAALYSSNWGMMMQDYPEEELERTRNMMMFMDPPKHTRYRLLVNREFIPRKAAGWQTQIEGLTRRIINEVCERGECDLVEDIAGKLPSYVVAELLGIPLEDGVRLYQLTETMHSAADAVTMEQRGAASEEMLAYGATVFEQKSQAPTNDLASKLIQSEIDGDRLTPDEFQQFFLLLVNAGGDTTRNLVGSGVLALLDAPDERARLQADVQALMPRAVEELLRYCSPVVHQRRTATRDTELGGKHIRAGDKVIMYYGSANRDEAVFVDPDRLDVGRSPNEHVAFGGGGPHHCLGAHLARVEIAAMFSELLTRLPDLELAGQPTWLASNFISGPTHVPVRFTPQPQLTA